MILDRSAMVEKTVTTATKSNAETTDLTEVKSVMVEMIAKAA